MRLPPKAGGDYGQVPRDYKEIRVRIRDETRSSSGSGSASRRYGAQGRNRTTDTMIFSHVLYQLSYPGSAAAAVHEGPASGWKRAYGEAGRAWQDLSGLPTIPPAAARRGPMVQAANSRCQAT